jgi:hypothetical protein
MARLLDSLTSTFTPDALGSVAKALGADAGTVQKAMGAVGPLLLGGLGNAVSTPSGAESLFKALPADGGGMLGGLGGMLGSLFGGGAPGASPVNQMLGSGSNAIGAALSRAFGFNVTPLISMAAPLLMGFISKAVKAGNLGPADVSAMVSKEHAAYVADPAHAETVSLLRTANDAGERASALVASYGTDWSKVALAPMAATGSSSCANWRRTRTSCRADRGAAFAGRSRRLQGRGAEGRAGHRRSGEGRRFPGHRRQADQRR